MMAATATTAGKLTARQIASLLGRNQGPEFFFQQPFAALNSLVIPKAVNLNRPLERFHIMWKGRIAVGTANITTVYPESIQNLIQQIKLNGTHATLKGITPILLTGADAFAWPKLFRSRGGTTYVNGARCDNLDIPAGFPAGTGFLGTTAGSPYDTEIHYDIPLTPVLPAAAKFTIAPFLYHQRDWGDTLQIFLAFADATALGALGTAVVTFTAFGSGAGSPQVYVFANYEILGALADKVSPAVVIRNTQNIPQGNITGASSVLQRLQLLQKQKTTNILLKSGLLAAGTSAGVSVYSALSDVIFEQTQVIVDNKPIRNNFLNAAYREYQSLAFDARWPQGYLDFSFIDSINPLTAYPGDQLAGGASFELDSQIATGNAANFAEVIQEQYLGTPGGNA
jgi:hypothetical protein